MFSQAEFVKSLLLQAAWFEAESFGGLKPMQMVAQCIANRVRLGWGDWSTVLSNLGKYSAADPEERAKRWLTFQLPDLRNPRLGFMYALVDQAYNNTGERLVTTGVLWANIQEIKNPWFLDAVKAAKYTRIAQNGSLVVWGEPL